MTSLSAKAIEYVSKSKYHIVGLVETHLDKEESAKARDQIAAQRWIVSSAAARPTGTSDKGNHGGALLAHKPWLQTSIPIEATGKGGCDMPDCDQIHKYFRIQGKDICVVFEYFNRSTGFKDENLIKIDEIARLTDGGRVSLVVCGDWNVIPAEWSPEVLDRLNMQIIAP